MLRPGNYYFFYFNDTATTEIYTLSLHDALPILRRLHLQLLRPPEHRSERFRRRRRLHPRRLRARLVQRRPGGRRSEEHTSELQSRRDLVCRLLLEKKKHYEIN